MRSKTTPPLLLGLALALAACGDEATPPARDDTPPVLEILSPAPEDTVIFAETVPVRARCREDDGRGCTVEVFLQGVLVAQGTDSVSAVVSLAQHADRSVRFTFEAVNRSGGRTTAESGEIWITSTHWVPIVTVPGGLQDASPKFALYLQGDHMHLVNVQTGTDQVIGSTTRWSGPNVVTAAGAVIAFALNHGVVKPTGIREIGGSGAVMGMGESASARGRWAAWRIAVSNTIYRDDVLAASLTHTPDSLVITDTYPGYDLAENGAVVFAAQHRGLGPSRLYLWKGDEIRLLFPDSVTVARGPVTDGTSVVYVRRVPAAGGNEYRLVHRGAGGEEVLATLPEPTASTPPELRPSSGYVMHNGWTAYHVPGGTGGYRLWIRAPSGERHEVWPGQGALQLLSLGPAGEVLVKHQETGRLYLVDPRDARGHPVDTPPSIKSYEWIDGQLYGMTNQTLFRLERSGS